MRRKRTALGPKTRIKLARRQVQAEILGICAQGKLASAMSAEGYAGGYYDALCDVELLLNGVTPARRNYWDIAEPGGSV